MDRVEYFFAIMALTGFALIFRAGLWSLWVLAQLTEARALWRRLLRLLRRYLFERIIVGGLVKAPEQVG